ncbi:hypothetical protein Mal52_21820 [Symmachiella dynata]|uniref:Type II secretion system protein G n=1 Tax=Symmachiella dynata TaxID=2527995 RepID=A0A517ZMK5_9PLAN|nr:hypothetical protein [Symmachiella dynata]QDU43706.1 hypothetical protein Mal52_21820 [Symmachiella dynata]
METTDVSDSSPTKSGVGGILPSLTTLFLCVLSFLSGLGVYYFYGQPNLTARGVTRRNLARMGRTFDAFFEENDRFPDPDQWQDEVRRGVGPVFVEQELLDGWNNLLQYKLVKLGKCEVYVLYSIGLDGIDSNGAGDDMVFPVGGYD